MIKKEFSERTKNLFHTIINSIDTSDKRKREYQVIVPEFITSTQINSKRVTKHEYTTYYPYFGDLDKFEEYQELIEFIENNFDLNLEKIEKLIQEFLNRSLVKCREKICEKEIEHFIEYLYDDLVKKPSEYCIKGYVIGIDMEDESYKIYDNLTIRKANSFDFECKDSGEYDSELRFYSFHFPPVILEYTYKSNNYNEYFNDYSRPKELGIELFFFDLALLLYRSAQVFRIKTNIKIKSLFSRDSTSSGFIPRITREKFLIDNNKIVDLRRIIKLFQSEEIRKIFLVSNKKIKYLQIALNRYQNSYFFAENKEQRVTSLISCLEALLSEGAQELKRRLSQRVSLILRTIGFNPLTVYKDVNFAYNIRNKYSHGNVVNLREKLKDENEFMKNFVEYARLCLLISLQINNIKGKKDYLKLIDQALLDEKSYKNLASLINDNCIIFKD